MSGQELHLLFNHVPVIGALWTLLLMLAALARPSAGLNRLALAFAALVGVACLPAFFTGEPAEEIVEQIPGIVEARLHEHEELAERALLVGIVTGVVALASLLAGRRRPERGTLLLPAFLLLIVLGGTLAWTAHEGGRIRRPELSGLETKAGGFPSGAGPIDDDE